MDAAAYLQKLVAFDTRNPEGHERPLLEFCAEELGRLGPDELLLESVPRRRGGPPTGYLYARFGAPHANAKRVTGNSRRECLLIPPMRDPLTRGESSDLQVSSG